MRIRRRFPTSSALIADPQLNRSRVVQQTTSIQLHPTHHHHHHHHHHVHKAMHEGDCEPSDDHHPIVNIKPKEGGKWRYTYDDDKQDQKDDGNTTNYISPRKQSTVLGVATTHTGFVPTSSTSHVVDGRWYDGDEVIPLKKRRGSIPGLVEKEEKIQPKMMSKTNKKCTTISMNDEQGSYDHVKESVEMSSRGSTKKMNKKGSGIVEGSRCSRVNGRGWRCCQQTLVGYSLCEHHLGKGRLRSIASVKNRAMGASINTSTSTIAPQPNNGAKLERLLSLSNSSSSSVLVQASQVKEMLLNDSSEDGDDEDDNDDDYEDGEKKKKNKKMAVVVRKKRMKLGMVKARSLSSLLSQTSNTAVSVASGFNNSN